MPLPGGRGREVVVSAGEVALESALDDPAAEGGQAAAGVRLDGAR